MPLSLRQSLDHYEISALLGAGGMGEVYRARDTRLNRDVAIKVLSSVSTVDEDMLRRFEQEAQATAALNHPNILAIYQMGSYTGAPYLVSELMEGETLRDRLRRGPLPIRKVIDYGVQISRGLAAAHDKGIVHRDLKPENLFLTKDGHVKILDFGLARLMQPRESALAHSDDTQTAAGLLLGTVGYMSPEQVRGQAADQRSDIFSFTAVLYEMLTGKRAFDKASPVETMSAILTEEPPAVTQLVPNTPPGVQRVLHRGLEKNPEQRFQSASDLGFALEALTSVDQSTYSNAYRLEKPAQKAPRNLWVAITIAALVVLAAAGYFGLRPVGTPRVADYVQLSHDGAQKLLLGTDGSRLFLTGGDSGPQGVVAIPVSGGEQTRIAMPAPGMFPVDLSPDGSAFLVIDGSGSPATGPLWSLPVLGDSPRRLDDASAHVAAWSADGKEIAYGKGSDVYLAKADGTDARRIGTMKNVVSGVAIEPGGKTVQVETEEIGQSGTGVVAGEQTIWNVPTDGSSARPLIPEWHDTNECCGRWTEDQKFFVFESRGQIWALPRTGRFFDRSPQPVQLTASPMQLRSPLPSKDGKKLFVVGMTFRGELSRFDLKTGSASPFLGGVSADWIDVSRDGKQVLYVSYPQGDLWRSSLDGADRTQLTFGPIKPVLPRWSPDGQFVLFFDFPDGPGKPGKIYMMPATGGTPRQLLPSDKENEQDPTWSSDGKRIVFGGDANDAARSTEPGIKILDVQSGNVSPVPGSIHMFSPRWSPDGLNLAAMSGDSTHLMLFDFKSQKWKEIATGSFSWINWSRDGHYIYLIASPGKDDAVARVGISDGKLETLVHLNSYVLAGLGGGSVSIAPDDSPLLLLDRGTQDVYSLDWKEP